MPDLTPILNGRNTFLCGSVRLVKNESSLDIRLLSKLGLEGMPDKPPDILSEGPDEVLGLGGITGAEGKGTTFRCWFLGGGGGGSGRSR